MLVTEVPPYVFRNRFQIGVGSFGESQLEVRKNQAATLNQNQGQERAQRFSTSECHSGGQGVDEPFR